MMSLPSAVSNGSVSLDVGCMLNTISFLRYLMGWVLPSFPLQTACGQIRPAGRRVLVVKFSAIFGKGNHV